MTMRFLNWWEGRSCKAYLFLLSPTYVTRSNYVTISWTWWLPSSNFFTDDFLCKAFLNLNTVAITLLTLFHLEVLPNRSVSMVIALTKISFLSSGSWASLHYINTLLWRCHNDSNFQRNRDPWNHILTFVNFVGSISLEL